jgi:hypothetical protein
VLPVQLRDRFQAASSTAQKQYAFDAGNYSIFNDDFTGKI